MIEVYIEHDEKLCSEECDLLISMGYNTDHVVARCALGLGCVGTDCKPTPSYRCPGPGTYNLEKSKGV